jgi:hypothetical protein
MVKFINARGEGRQTPPRPHSQPERADDFRRCKEKGFGDEFTEALSRKRLPPART